MSCNQSITTSTTASVSTAGESQYPNGPQLQSLLQSPQDAVVALEDLNGQVLDGTVLHPQWATPSPQKAQPNNATKHYNSRVLEYLDSGVFIDRVLLFLCPKDIGTLTRMKEYNKAFGLTDCFCRKDGHRLKIQEVGGKTKVCLWCCACMQCQKILTRQERQWHGMMTWYESTTPAIEKLMWYGGSPQFFHGCLHCHRYWCFECMGDFDGTNHSWCHLCNDIVCLEKEGSWFKCDDCERNVQCTSHRQAAAAVTSGEYCQRAAEVANSTCVECLDFDDWVFQCLLCQQVFCYGSEEKYGIGRLEPFCYACTMKTCDWISTWRYDDRIGEMQRHIRHYGGLQYTYYISFIAERFGFEHTHTHDYW